MGEAPESGELAPRDVRKALSGSPFAGNWRVSRAQSGWSRRSFVAMDGAQRLFLKFDIAIDPLRRLADLAVTPPMLYAGEYRGHAFVVQPYLPGRRPGRTWFDEHPSELARHIRTYQRDGQLKDLLATPAIPTSEAHLAAVVQDLEDRCRRNVRRPTGTDLAHAIGQLRKSSLNLQAADLVPTHGDPNRKNFILTDEVYLVDWDDLAVSDPMRDIGQLLWWYVSPSRWDAFFSAFRLDGNDGLLERLYWWVAAESLDVALMFTEAGNRDGANEFYNDFAAAIERRANPHARV